MRDAEYYECRILGIMAAWTQKSNFSLDWIKKRAQVFSDIHPSMLHIHIKETLNWMCTETTNHKPTLRRLPSGDYERIGM